ncbi:hypothetical protein LTR27_011551 [Elasticomyces elasticus]|nr:hypothetical protein LTR27_011551 [Elasticomyces elasticus]
MTPPTLTPEALAHAEDVAQRYKNGALVFGLLAWLPLAYALIQIHARTRYRIFLFLVPSAYPIGLFTACVTATILMKTGVSINWLGIRIRVAALPPQVTDTFLSRVYHLKDEDEVMAFLGVLMIAVIVFGLLGLVVVRNDKYVWCDGCKQERTRSDFREADYGQGGDKPGSARCRRCQDLEGGGFAFGEKLSKAY